MTEPEPGKASSSRAPGVLAFALRPGLLGFSATLVAIIAVGVPVFTTVMLGAAPYEQIFHGFPGLDVGITTAVLLVGADAGSMVSIGALVHLLFLRGASPRRARQIEQGFDIAVLRVAAGVWTACAGGLVVFKAVDSSGLPLSRLAEPGAFAYLYEASYAPGAWTVSFVAGLLVLFVAFFADSWTGLLIPLGAAAVAVLAPVVTGQVLVGPEHDFGGDAAVFQTLAVNAFFGAVVVAVIKAASGQFMGPEMLRRLFLVASIALPVIVASDFILAWFKLAGVGVTGSLTGWMILARWTCLALVLVSTGIAWSLRQRGRSRGRSVIVLLTVTSFAIAGWIGVTAAMTRQPPPQYFVPTSISQVFMGFEVPAPPTAVVLFTQWRPNLLFLGIAVAAVTVYLVAVRTLQRRGDRWATGRTTSWLLGWTVVVVATSSGFAKYSAPDFGVHMIVHMSLTMLAPLLLVLGGVATLLLRATQSRPGGPAGVHDWVTWVLHWPVLRFLYDPLIVFVVFIGSYYGLYLTPLFGEIMRFHWAHQLMNLHFLIVGYLYYSLVIGVDRPPRPLPHIGKLGYVLAAMPFHAFFGIILMTSASTRVVAENFYRHLDLPWADLEAQQYLGGGVAWAGGEIPLMIVIVILAIQWTRQDAKEARRKDRHLDTGRDDEYEVYNQMLTRLADRKGAGPARNNDLKIREEPQS